MAERKFRDEVAGRGGSFGALLRDLREGAGLTQEELALRAGLSPNAVGALERGQRKRPYPHTVRALADALELPEGERAALLMAVPERSGPASSAEEASSASRTVPALAHPATPLVGRERELEELRGLLTRQGVRLLTLTGIGGVGKTRLAAEVVREIGSHFSDGAAFVELAPLSDPSLVVPTVLRLFGVPEAEDRAPPREALIDHLREKGLLLVLDNFEHLLQAAPEVAALIDACPELVVMVTSRAPLRIRGEQQYPVPPLALPTSTRSPREEEVLAFPSGVLFVERARAASPDFTVNRENAEAVARVCWRLAGLPLALELAAAKVRFLDPATLLSRLDRALSSAGARDLPERQRTLRATLDWSYDLLGEQERELFRRLSVFFGGFTLEAAEVVGADSDVAGSAGVEEVLDLLGALVEQSLVVAEPGSGGYQTRYGMLEPVRQYALEKLEQCGESEAVRRYHAAFFLELAERGAPKLRGPDELEWLERLERENDNLRAVFSWALGATGDVQTAARLGWALELYLWVRGRHREGRQWAEVALEHDLPDALRARVLHLAGMTAYIQGDYPAAGGRWAEALRLSQRAGDPLLEAYSRASTGLVEMVRPDQQAAISSLEEAIALFQRCDDDYMVSVSRVWLGSVLLTRGEGERAQRTLEEALAWVRSSKNPTLTLITLYSLVQSALTRKDYAEAGCLLEEAIGLSGRIGDRANLAHLLETLAAVRALYGEAQRSAVLLGAAEGLLEEVGARVYNYYVPDPSLKERAVVEARAALGDAAFEEAWSRGREMGFDQAIGYALGADATRGGSASR